jgi:hypothetical protein
MGEFQVAAGEGGTVSDFSEIELLRWSFIRNTKQYRAFFDSIDSASYMAKRDNYISVSGVVPGHVATKLRDSWGLLRPVDYRNPEPKLPLLVQSPVKRIPNNSNNLIFEVDTSFKETTIRRNFEDLLSKFYAENRKRNQTAKHQRNVELRLTKLDSRAYELKTFENKDEKTIARTLYKQFPKLRIIRKANGKKQTILDDDGVGLSRWIKDRMKAYAKRVEGQDPDFDFRAISYFSPLAYQSSAKAKLPRRRSKTVHNGGLSWFMKELKKIK